MRMQQSITFEYDSTDGLPWVSTKCTSYIGNPVDNIWFGETGPIVVGVSEAVEVLPPVKGYVIKGFSGYLKGWQNERTMGWTDDRAEALLFPTEWDAKSYIEGTWKNPTVTSREIEAIR